MGSFIADLVLQILSFVAQYEREEIRKRQAEGILAAKRIGVRFGRPRKEIAKDVVEAISQKETNINEVAKLYNISYSTVYRRLVEYCSTDKTH